MPLLCGGRSYPFPAQPYTDCHAAARAMLKDKFGEDVPEDAQVRLVDSPKPLKPGAKLVSNSTYVMDLSDKLPDIAQGASWDLKVDLSSNKEMMSEFMKLENRTSCDSFLQCKATVLTPPPRPAMRQQAEMLARPILLKWHALEQKAKSQSSCVLHLCLESVNPRKGAKVWPFDNDEKTGFICAPRGNSWDGFDLAVFPTSEQEATAYVLPVVWLTTAMASARKELTEAKKLILVLDLDKTILELVQPFEYDKNRVRCDRADYPEAQQLAANNLAENLKIGGFEGVVVPRANLLELVCTVYNADSHFDVLFCTHGSLEYGTRCLKIIKKVLTFIASQMEGARELVDMVSNFTDVTRLYSERKTGETVGKSLVHLVQDRRLADLAIVVDDNVGAWIRDDRHQVIPIKGQRGPASHGKTEGQELAELSSFLKALHTWYFEHAQSCSMANAIEHMLKSGKNNSS